MGTDFPLVSGIYARGQMTPRNIFVGGQIEMVPTFSVMDGSKSRDPDNSDDVTILRAGLIIGKVTASGKYAPSIIGLTQAAATASTGTVTLSLTAAAATEVARRVGATGTLTLIGGTTGTGTVALQTVTFNSVTVNGTSSSVLLASLAADVASKSVVADTDGSQAPLTVLAHEYGLPVTDMSGTSIDQPLVKWLREADFVATKIINLTESNTSVQAWLKGQLNNAAFVTFDNDR